MRKDTKNENSGRNTMKQELISIIVLAYNTELYIKECLDSICKQTYQNLEILVILDGCTDKTSNIVKKYAKKDSRICVIAHENKGTCFCRMEGYENANGKYILYVDSDDWIEKDMVEIMYKNLRAYKVDIVHCQYKRFSGGELQVPKNILNRNVKMTDEEFEPMFYDLLYHTNNCNSICRQLIHKKIMKCLSEVDSTLLYNEDLACNLAIYKQMQSILFIPDELYIYRKNMDGITKSIDIELVRKKISDMCRVHYALYNSTSEFKIHDRKHYKKMACIQLLHQLTYLFKQLQKTNQYNRMTLSAYMESICYKSEVLEMIEYLRKEPDYVSLKEMGLQTYYSGLCILKEKYSGLYYYYRFVYPIMNFMERKLRK